MATETQANDVPPSDYERIPKPIGRVDAEARFPATCMIWGVVIGIGLLVAIVLCWALSNLGSIDFGAIFQMH